MCWILKWPEIDKMVLQLRNPCMKLIQVLEQLMGNIKYEWEFVFLGETSHMQE